MSQPIYTCTHCGQALPLGGLLEVHGELFCPDCLDNSTVVCRCCGERIWREENYGTDDYPLCDDCYQDHFTNCVRCDALIHVDDVYYDDDDNGYCWNCYTHCQNSDDSLHSYDFKPTPIFYGGGPRYLGVELEIDEGGEDRHNAEILADLVNDNQDRLYVKRDGSLSEGLELVTHPMTLDYHLAEMPWPELLDKARQLGYRSHQAGTCGLHVHVNRTAFGQTEAEQDACIARVLFFFEKHWEELLKFSRRTQRQLDRWASRYGYKEHPKDILEHAKKGCHAGRYTCVNLTNCATIEFRMFRGTLKLNTLFATLQLVDHICEMAIQLTDQEMTALSWTSFAAGCTASELVQYLKERRLYVNDEVPATEEV